MRTIDADLLKENIRRHCILPAWVYTLIDAEIDGQPTDDPVDNINRIIDRLEDLKAKPIELVYDVPLIEAIIKIVKEEL